MNTAHKCMGVEPSPGAPSSFYHGVQQVSIYESGGGTHTKTRTLYVCINSKSVFLYSSSASLNLIAYRWACVDLWWGSVMNMVMGFPTIIQYNSNNHFKRFWHCVLQIIQRPQILRRMCIIYAHIYIYVADLSTCGLGYAWSLEPMFYTEGRLSVYSCSLYVP